MTYDYNDNVNDNSNGNQAGERRTCIDCGLTWIYTPEEKRFIEVEKGFSQSPRRCRECRAFKRAARTQPPSWGH